MRATRRLLPSLGGGGRGALLLPLLALALVGSAAWTLRGDGAAALLCEDGRLVARRMSRVNLFPPRPMDDLPPLPVPEGMCKDEHFSSPSALRARWTTLAGDLVEAALARDDAPTLEAMLPVTDALERSKGGRTSVPERGRGPLLLALARADLDAARRHQLRARTRILEARRAGADEKILRALEGELAALCAAPQARTAPPRAPAPRPSEPRPPGPGPRDL